MRYSQKTEAINFLVKNPQLWSSNYLNILKNPSNPMLYRPIVGSLRQNKIIKTFMSKCIN